MTCTDLTNDLLVDYGDWRIGPEDRSRVTRHLEGCEPCRLRREDLEVMAGALGRSSEPPPPALVRHLDRAILGDSGRLSNAPASGRALRVRPGRLAGIAAGLLLAMLGGYLAGRRAAPDTLLVKSAPGTPSGVPGPSLSPGRRDSPDPRTIPIRPDGPPGGAPTPRPEIPPPAPLAHEPSPARAAPPLPLHWDLNGDGVVDIADVRILE
ncbi:MAG TPA: zf-HC2 domain-containing protein, partial [Planctomycetota bacterium]|nr:zf-HC2 domain-containing protein [Planctomycetota bacterium]